MRIFSKKYSQCTFFLFILLFFACLSTAGLAAQEAPAAQETTAAPTNESEILLDTAATGTGMRVPSSSSSVWALFRIVLVLVLVCAGIYGIVHFLKKGNIAEAADDPYLKSVANLPLAQGRSVHIITAGNQAFLVGSTDHAVSLISEIADRELIDAMNLAYEKKSPVPQTSFQTVLAHFFPQRTGSGGEAVTGQTEGFLSKQRERLRKGGDKGTSPESRE
jgi:flagellar protein FliO/FliZ